MAAFDGGDIAFSRWAESHKHNEGTGAPISITLAKLTGSANWSRPNTDYHEVMNNGKRLTGGPVLRKTGDTTVTLTIESYVSSLLSATAADSDVYQFLFFEGIYSANVSVSAGDQKAVQAVITYNSTAAGGGSITATFDNAVCTQCEMEPSGQENTFKLTATLVCHINAPIIT